MEVGGAEEADTGVEEGVAAEEDTGVAEGAEAVDTGVGVVADTRVAEGAGEGDSVVTAVEGMEGVEEVTVAGVVVGGTTEVEQAAPLRKTSCRDLGRKQSRARVEIW